MKLIECLPCHPSISQKTFHRKRGIKPCHQSWRARGDVRDVDQRVVEAKALCANKRKADAEAAAEERSPAKLPKSDEVALLAARPVEP